MRYSVYTEKGFSTLNIDNIGLSDEPNITRFGPGIRPEYYVFYVLKGKGFFNNHSLKAGQGFISEPPTVCEYHSDPNDPWTLLWIVAEDSDMKYMIRYYNADATTNIFEFDYIEKLQPSLDAIKKNAFKIITRAEILEIYMSILKHQLLAEVSGRKTLQQIYIDSAVKYIKANYQLSISVIDIANILGISRPYLFKLFVDFFGISPKQYIIDYRMNKAKEMFIQTDLPVKYVANSVGYSDQFAFSKIFTEKLGMSPREFKTMHSKKYNPK